jgi:hypothetical protein
LKTGSGPNRIIRTSQSSIQSIIDQDLRSVLDLLILDDRSDLFNNQACRRNILKSLLNTMYYDSNLGRKAVFCYLRTQITMDGDSFDTYDMYKNILKSLLNTILWVIILFVIYSKTSESLTL